MIDILRGLTLGFMLGAWAHCLFVLPGIIKEQGRETRRLVLETVNGVMRNRGPLHQYSINLNDQLCVTNVVDDGKVVYP